MAAMERQMKAEREKRESILLAEGEKQSKILIAEGEKESAILRADAVREQKIREAAGEAEAIRTVQQAVADGIRMLNEAAPTREVIALRSLESFEKAADGQATKIIIPSEIQGVAGLAASLKELVIPDGAEKAQNGAKPAKKPASAPAALFSVNGAHTAPQPPFGDGAAK